jgi:hypothetical protein
MEYKDVHNTSYHYAEIYKRNKLIASSRNKIGSRSRGSGWSTYTLHAELAVLKRFGDLSKLVGCILIVVRINKENELLGSKPCPDCEKVLLKHMKQYGLLKVLYS